MQTGSDESETTDITPIVDPLSTDEPVNVELLVPDVYHECLSWKSWVKRALPYIALLVFIPIALTISIFSIRILGELTLLIGVLLLLMGTFGAFMTYREYWRWRHEPYVADPEHGVLFQYQAKNKLLFLLGSDPRQLKLDTAEYLPRAKTFWEHYLPFKGFRESCTVTFEGPSQLEAEFFSDIHDFMHGDKVAAIILYRQYKQQRNQEKDLSLQERQALSSEMTATMLASILERLEELIELFRPRL